MNQTDVRTFKAATMQEALDIVRQELGPEAVILHTRELPPPRFLKWRKTDQRVEITAGTGVNVRTPRAMLSNGSRGSAAATGQAAPRRTDENLSPPPPLLPKAAPAAQRMPYVNQPASRPVTPVETPFPARPTAVSYNLAPGSSAQAPSSPAPATPITEQQSAIARQLSSIQQMVSQLTRGSLHQQAEIPAELFQLYTELIDVEVEEDLARDLINQLKGTEGAEKPGDVAASKARLRGIVEGDIRCASPIVATPGRRRVVALVGPTGVGKTTTIAKLAANFRLRDGIRMGLVTVDTYRIAAVEQLRTYAEIIDLPMKVVTTPREMRRALDELAGLDLVLIDTAGRSPRDELKIQELKSLLAEAQVDEVHLVLSLAASARSLQATAEKFAPAGTTAMILTKLDEAVGMGSLLSVSRRVPLPVSYLTTGQDVPDDIEHASAKRIARLVLGEESLFGRRRREEASTT
ncbi:MAG: flagellar biosynthesis protein FlhF [Planctomycetia bacterium]|nr:flagellar biosynthesis protein FlhF [Planctomycetia bacterium]